MAETSAFTIARNTAFLFISEIITKVLAFFVIIAMARILGDVELGKYFFAVAYVGTFLIFSDFGVTTLMFREVAKNRELTSKYFNNVFTFRALTALIVLLISIIAIPLVGKSSDIAIIIALTAAYFFLTEVTQPFRILFNAYEKLEYYALVSIIQIAILAALATAFLFRGLGLKWVLYAFIASYFISLVVSIFVVNRKFVKFRPEIDLAFWKFMFKKALPFWFTGLFMVIYSRIDTLMLTAMKSYAVVGWYNAAWKMVDALNFIPFVLTGAIFPALSKLSISDKLVSDKLYKKVFYYLFLISLPIAIGATMLASRLIIFIYKSEFTNSALALQITVWSAVFFFGSFLAGYLLNAIDKAKLFTITAGICVLVNALLNAVLIPLFKTFEGAAIAAVATQFVSLVLLVYFAMKNGYSPNFKILLKAVISGMVMAAAIYFMAALHIATIIPLAIVVYFAALYLVRGVGREEISLIKYLLKGAKTKIFK